MKKMIAILSLMTISSSAFAMHGYGEDSCVAKMINGSTLEIQIANGEPVNPHYIPNRSDDQADMVTVEFKGAPVGGNEQGSELVLQLKSDKDTSSRKTSDGCFEGYEKTSNRVAEVQSISSKLNQSYGIKKGTKVYFVCYTSASAPTGKHCQ
ncbi:MAG: hypothetical protein H7235_04865 [Bdellovibrionaceae bacterium]|nr:hypothetical protein [Pseudobdellovibrionaceae bacterium]